MLYICITVCLGYNKLSFKALVQYKVAIPYSIVSELHTSFLLLVCKRHCIRHNLLAFRQIEKQIQLENSGIYVECFGIEHLQRGREPSARREKGTLSQHSASQLVRLDASLQGVTYNSDYPRDRRTTWHTPSREHTPTSGRQPQDTSRQPHRNRRPEPPTHAPSTTPRDIRRLSLNIT